MNSSQRYVSTKPVRRFLSQIVRKSSRSSCTTGCCPVFYKLQNFFNTLDLDGHKTRRTTSVPSYLLYFLFKSVFYITRLRLGILKDFLYSRLYSLSSHFKQTFLGLTKSLRYSWATVCVDDSDFSATNIH